MPRAETRRLVIEATEWVRESRCGSCWRCMTFSGLMLALSVAGALMVVRWQAMEGPSSTLVWELALGVALVSTGCFAMLSAAHVACLILRRSVWRA